MSNTIKRHSRFFTTNTLNNRLPTEFIENRGNQIRFLYCRLIDTQQNNASVFDAMLHADWIAEGHELNNFVGFTGDIADHNEIYTVVEGLKSFKVWFTSILNPDIELDMNRFKFVLKIELKF